jgi:hypothetical protein
MSVSVEFVPRDLWIGVYWNLRENGVPVRCPGIDPYTRFRASVYVCIVPMLPIIFRWKRAEDCPRKQEPPQ